MFLKALGQSSGASWTVWLLENPLLEWSQDLLLPASMDHMHAPPNKQKTHQRPSTMIQTLLRLIQTSAQL